MRLGSDLCRKRHVQDEKKPGLKGQVYFLFRVRLEAARWNRVLHVSTRRVILALLTAPSI